MSPTFSSLSPELLISILQWLSSPEDLYSAIGATSQLYRVFTTYRRSILSAVLLRAIPPQVEADFLLAYRAQRIWDHGIEDFERPLDKYVDKGLVTTGRREKRKKLETLNQETIVVLEAAEPGKSEELHNFVSDSESLTKLWRFYRKFEDLLTLCARKALSNLQRTSGALDDAPKRLALFYDEQVRFQRAFFRWEVFTCLFQISQQTRDDRTPPPSDDPAPTYAAMFPLCEMEEMFFVGQFYKTLIENICDELEEDFVTTVKAKEAVYHPLPDPDTPAGPERPLDISLDYHCFWWYDESSKGCYGDCEVHVAYLVARGMLSVWKLKNAPFQTVRTMIVKSHFDSKDQLSIMIAVGDVGRSRDKVDEISKDCSLGWQWAAAGQGWTWLSAPANYGLKNQGYVFWDQARLEKTKQFQSPRCPVKNSFDYPPGYQERTIPGVQTKLKDCQAHSKVLEEMHDEIYGEDYPDDVIKWRD